MKLAFCLFNYFPYGGLQRDFLRIAQACYQRGHEIHVYTMRWEGDTEPAFQLHLIKASGWQNHTRIRSFVKKLKQQLDATHYDLVIGFNKMPYLDIYYAADVCYQSRMKAKRRLFYQLLPRYRQLTAFEDAVFKRGHKTDILLISPLQQPEFIYHYQTEEERFQLLPPGIAKDRIAPPNAQAIRHAMRSTYQIPPDHLLLLMVGSGFKTKGLDRTLFALASLPAHLQARCHLFIIGQDNTTPFLKLARKYHIEKRIYFLGGRSDVPHFLLAADFLLHPAYHENTGTVLLEAMVSGLPVLTVDVCGYAHYVKEANAGIVLTTPFQQAAFNDALQAMLLSSQHETWRQNGLALAKNNIIYSLPEKAADFIEQAGEKRAPLSK